MNLCQRRSQTILRLIIYEPNIFHRGPEDLLHVGGSARAAVNCLSSEEEAYILGHYADKMT